jgi:hypothetical protein
MQLEQTLPGYKEKYTLVREIWLLEPAAPWTLMTLSITGP